jgi:hypothetical protein
MVTDVNPTIYGKICLSIDSDSFIEVARAKLKIRFAISICSFLTGVGQRKSSRVFDQQSQFGSG